jgi:hypothetical protein
MLGRVQRRLGAEARANDGLRFARDWSLVLAALGLTLAALGAAFGSKGAVLLVLAAGLALLCAAWYSALAAYFGRRARRHADARRAEPPHGRAVDGALPKEIVGDWLLTVSLFPLATGVAFFEGTLPDGVGAAALSGFLLAAIRVWLQRSLPDTITMTEEERARLTSLLKLTAVVAGAGYLTVTVIAIFGGDTWLPIWPGLLLGLLCGMASVVQLGRATANARPH